ncbi:SET and MYND domain-containing protein 4 [Holothuria leucospilota]|uniref:Protein-lysine N-methyltransferase SMYD4 n=1 Tax=Holothuria leucospilota TaxID=206669 RepID=A0A9Q1CCJ3_HOLLE|nr:SET and MYND domain-containing protein 4 [Holothuria leucospilota]
MQVKSASDNRFCGMAVPFNWDIFVTSAWEIYRLDADLQNCLDGRNLRSLTERCTKLALWSDARIQQIVNSLPNISSATKKSDHEAGQLRLKGNNFFQKKLYHKALRCYSKAVLHASVTDSCENFSVSQLSLAYANRSAALFYLQKWKLCINDVDRAIKHGYSKDQRYKVLVRKGECLINEGCYQDAEKVLKESLSSLADSSLAPDQLKAKSEKIERLLSQCKTKKLHKETDIINTTDNEATDWKRNSKLENACSCVSLRCSEKKGRHLVADSTIDAGETLIKEKPFAGVLLPSCHQTHCHHCFQKTLAPVMCRSCVSVQYCSQICSDKAWGSYHLVECSMWEILQQVGTSSHLGLRILLIAEIHKASSLSSMLDSLSLDGIPGCSADGRYLADYRAVYSLQPHVENHTKEDLFKAVVVGILLSVCVYKVLLEEKAHTSWNLLEKEEVTLSAALIARHILQLRCNVHAITSVQPEDYDEDEGSIHNKVDTIQQVRIASAVYPTTALMNHGCDPNVIASFQNNEITIRATRCIPNGEEIRHCYGPHVSHMSVDERKRKLLNQYFFSCDCRACLSTSDTAFDWSMSFKCPSCDQPATLIETSLICSNKNCLHKQTSEEYLKMKDKADRLFQEGKKLCEEGDVEKSLDKLHQCLNIQHKILCNHSKPVAEVEDTLARCYAMQGDFITSANYLERSISTVEMIYGKESIELGQELHKLAQLLFNGQQVAKAQKVIARAVLLLSRYHGKQHPSVQELLEMQDCLSSL